ncbi:MAG: hypothetical protein V3S25_12175 [Nitrospirales bacterium]
MKQVGVFTATRWELNAVRRALLVEAERRIAGSRCILARSGDCRLWLFQMGMGVENSSAVCRTALASQDFDLAVSSGFACALIPSQIGDLLIGTRVVSHDRRVRPPDAGGSVTCTTSVMQAACEAAARAEVPARLGLFVTVPHVVWRAQEKHEIQAACGAVGLDMESFQVGKAAQERHVPFVVVRAVSDLLEEDLPMDFNQFLTPAGWLPGAAACLRYPSSLVGLGRLRAQCTTAATRMTSFFREFAEDLARI